MIVTATILYFELEIQSDITNNFFTIFIQKENTRNLKIQD